MHVGFLETFWHPHILYYLSAAADAAGHDVTVFTTPDVIEDVPPLMHDLDITARVYERREQAVAAAGDYDIDALLIPTIGRKPEFIEPYLRLDVSCPVGLSIYNLNTWLYAVEGDVVPQPALGAAYAAILDQIDALVLEYSPWLRRVSDSPVDIPACWFPPTLHTEVATDLDPNQLRVAVPGAVRPRRDYATVVTAFEALFREHADRLALSIVGRIDRGSEGFLEWLRACEAAWYDIEYWDDGEYIPRQEYDAALARSDVLLLSSVHEEQRLGITEVMGETTGTGGKWDALRLGRPMLLPEHYALGDEISPATMTYMNEIGLQQTIDLLLDENFDTLEKMQHRAQETAARFTVEHQADRFNRVLLTLGLDVEVPRPPVDDPDVVTVGV